MKKFLTLCATFVFIGALFVGCIDNKEPDSVIALRTEKILLIKAQTDLVTSQAELNRAYAAFSYAEAERERAVAEIRRQEAEALRIDNEYERGILEAKIAWGIARLNAERAFELARMWEAQELARANEEAYLTGLIEQRARLWGAQIQAFDDIFDQILALLRERADVQNQLLILAAQKHFYETVSMPFVENELRHELEIAEINLTYGTEMLKIWEVIKDLAVEEYLAYAEEMYPKMQAMKEREVVLTAKEAGLEFELQELRKNENLARDAYDNSGVNTDLTNISIKNVFGKNATDLFATYGTLGTGNKDGKSVITGVYKNEYSFFYNTFKEASTANDAYPQGTYANLGYKNTLDVLKSDYNTINNERLFTADGKVRVEQDLALRKHYMDNAVKNFTDNTKLWKESYNIVKDGPTWAAERTEFTNALNAIYGTASGTNAEILAGNGGYTMYGLPYAAPPATGWNYTFYNVPGLSPLTSISNLERYAESLFSLSQATGGNYREVIGTYANLAKALAIPDVNDRNAFIMEKLPVNFLYYIQKTIIEEYMMILDTLMQGDNYNDWIGAGKEISDVLGGIAFNPGALLETILGPANAALFIRIVNTVLDIANASDLISMLNALMPAYYQKTQSFLGSAIYGDGPIFQKYHVTNNWEYHAWFLIYYLMQGHTLNIGGGILTINVAGFTDAITKLQEDFLGASSNGYPGNYTYATLPAQSTSEANWYTGTAITNADRISLSDKVFGSKSANAAINGAFANVVAKENALRTKYIRWYRAWEQLNMTEKSLYEPYNRAWTIYNSNTPAQTEMTGWAEQKDGNGWKLVSDTPPWMRYLPGGNSNLDRVVVLKPVASDGGTGSATDPWRRSELFHFMPELALNRDVPSLTEDLFWTDVYTYTGSSVYDEAYYATYQPYIGVYTSRLVSVNWWSTASTVGVPKYNGNPVLWPWDYKALYVTYNHGNWGTSISNPMSQTGSAIIHTPTNSFRPSFIVPTAKITMRNYDQFAFWASDETQDAYQALAEKIAEHIDALQAKVDELYQAWVDATAARILKEYEIEAMKVEAGLCAAAYNDMLWVHQNLLANGVVGKNFYLDYDYWFNLHNERLRRYNFAYANYNTFMDEYSRYIYSDGGMTNGLYDFVEDLRKYIDGDIEGYELRLKYIDAQLALMYAEYNKMVDIVF